MIDFNDAPLQDTSEPRVQGFAVAAAVLSAEPTTTAPLAERSAPACFRYRRAIYRPSTPAPANTAGDQGRGWLPSA
jgi:hypothetical protein